MTVLNMPLEITIISHIFPQVVLKNREWPHRMCADYKGWGNESLRVTRKIHAITTTRFIVGDSESLAAFSRAPVRGGESTRVRNWNAKIGN